MLEFYHFNLFFIVRVQWRKQDFLGRHELLHLLQFILSPLLLASPLLPFFPFSGGLVV